MRAALVAGVALWGAASACAQSLEWQLPPRSPLEQRMASVRFKLERVIVTGVTALQEPEVAAVVQPFVGRFVGGPELGDMARRVEALYESRGFVGTRVRLEDQPIQSGTLHLRVDEVRLAAIEVSGNSWNRRRFVEWSVWPPTEGVLNLPRLQERLARLKEVGLFDRIAADLRLSGPEGEGATLKLDLAEALPFSASASVANDRAPSVGSVRSEVAVSHRSLLGWGDTFVGRWGRTRGIDDSELGYTVPIPLTPVAVFARRVRSDSLAVDPPAFRDLEIVAVTDTDAFGATASLVKTENAAVAMGVSHERRETATYLLGIPFSFTPGLPDGVSRFRVNRGSVEGAWRAERTAYSARIGYSRGRIGEVVEVPDGLGLRRDFHFVQAALGAVRRLDVGELRARIEGQHAGQALPPIERIAIGGASTVRGYRENLLLRDSGAIASLQWRLPERELRPWLKLTPALFVDAGWGRNHRQQDDGLPRTIASLGVALEVVAWRHLRLAAAFALPSQRNLTPRDDLQDRGIHLAVALSYP
jgi:hemolysin activation/secretion protein